MPTKCGYNQPLPKAHRVCPKNGVFSGTLRDWEQGRTKLDQAARAYLTVIVRNPEAVREALVPAA